MPVNASVGAHSEEVLHFAGVRLRVTGIGNLDLVFASLDTIDTQTLSPIVMANSTAREPTRLANFISQRGMLRVGTNVIDEVFRINRIIVFAKPIWSQYPG